MEKHFLVKVKGVSFANEDGTSRQGIIKQLQKGQDVKLQPEPTNPHDRWAVQVVTSAGQQIGWLPSDARDADALLKGEPIAATIHAIYGGTNWFFRALGKKTIGVILAIRKNEPDWIRRVRLETLAKPFDEKIVRALHVEQTGDLDRLVVELKQVISDVRSFTRVDPQASAHRRFPAPIDRLTLVLERQGKFAEALDLINDWGSTFDPVQPTKAESDRVRKRAERLQNRLKK